MRPNKHKKRQVLLALLLSICATAWLAPAPKVGAADHGDAPFASLDRSADINDAYVFLDPNDNSKVVFAMTVNGFIVPAEASNFGIFDHNVQYRFEIEASGDPIPEYFHGRHFFTEVDVCCNSTNSDDKLKLFYQLHCSIDGSKHQSHRSRSRGDHGLRDWDLLFAGLVDDPFFFDIPGFNRFVASVLAGAPNAANLQRGRDSFAGYNTLAIAFSVPAARIRQVLTATANNSVGFSVRTSRVAAAATRIPGRFPTAARFVGVDRMGNPAVNVALIPFVRKNEYNAASGEADARGDFVNSIAGTLTALGTNATNIGILASVAISRGDILRLNLNSPNSGPGGGNNTGGGFPNGRRLADDTIDTILFFVANQNVLGDSVNANDVPLRSSFPFFGASQQPREQGADDNTRN